MVRAIMAKGRYCLAIPGFGYNLSTPPRRDTAVMPFFRRLAMTLTVAFAMTMPTMASSQALLSPETDDGKWRHSLTYYLFLPFQTKGTSTVGGQSADIDLDLGEVLEVLQGAISGRYEGWRGDWGIKAEGYYVNIGGDQTLPTPTLTNVDVTAEQYFLMLQGAYRFAHGRTASGRKYAWDAAAGVKYNSVKQTIDITNGPFLSVGGTEDWFEPVVSLRFAMEISDKWVFGTRADLSGFGVGGNDLQYTVLAGFQWQAWNRTALRFGYQAYGLDFSTTRSDGAFAYQIDQHGPYLGLTYQF